MLQCCGVRWLWPYGTSSLAQPQGQMGWPKRCGGTAAMRRQSCLQLCSLPLVALPPHRREGFFWQQNGARRLYAADALFGGGQL